VLTLLAGQGALTQNGREGIEYVLTSLKWDKSWWDECICLATGLLLASLILCWFSLPRIADHYIQRGYEAYEADQLTVAEKNYNRALKLNPENTEVYYKLGGIYQELADYNKAIENYKIAWKGNKIEAADEIASLYLKQKKYDRADEWLKIVLEPLKILLDRTPYNMSKRDIKILSKLDSLNPKKDGRIKKFVAALNEKQFKVLKKQATLSDKQFEVLRELAYVYLKKKQYSDTERWLYIGLPYTKNDNNNKQENDNNNKQATMLAYQGWIQLDQERYLEAETPLLQAISLNNKLASAHCLLAQVFEKQNKQNDAKNSWEQCLQYASLYDQDENHWIGLATKSLKSKGKAQ
jgi:Tfp pilus assembly protein PilF